VYAIEVASGVLADLARLRAFDRRRILDAIEAPLSTEPARATRHRKVLVGLVPPFEALSPVWQLSIGEYRVFYDVSAEDRKVYVRAVRRKPAHTTTEEIL
jgi:mRNA-degrading endonuclease RelE of RelBE toxin-antitoxin system